MADLLVVEGLHSGYGEAVVVQGISLKVPQGESLALLGRNGTASSWAASTSRSSPRTSAQPRASAGCRRSATSSSR